MKSDKLSKKQNTLEKHLLENVTPMTSSQLNELLWTLRETPKYEPSETLYVQRRGRKRGRTSSRLQKQQGADSMRVITASGYVWNGDSSDE